MKRLPTFIIIGAARSGTTSIYHYLGQHPCIYMSPVKESNFFCCRAMDKERKGIEGDSKVKRYLTAQTVTNLNGYHTLFAQMGNAIAGGEASPRYLYYPGTAARIRELLPNVRLIAILRQPAERAYSHFRLNRGLALENLEFKEALAAETDRIREGFGWDWHYINVGQYCHQLKNYYRLFDSRQIKVVLYDDLVKDPAAFLQEICRFIGVSPEFEFNTETRHNFSYTPLSTRLESLIKMPGFFASAARAAVPPAVRRKASSALRKFNAAAPAREPLNLEEYGPCFHEGIKQLEELIDRDLLAWLA